MQENTETYGKELTEIGNQATWTLSSAKPGNGVQKLRDDNIETFWQSDGVQPHSITIQFHKIVKVQEIVLYLDLKHDESYTPKEICIKGGNDFRDLKDICTVTFTSPEGWQKITFKDKKEDLIKYSIIQILILKNFHNGRDSHIRQIKIFSPTYSL